MHLDNTQTRIAILLLTFSPSVSFFATMEGVKIADVLPEGRELVTVDDTVRMEKANLRQNRNKA